MSKDHTDETVEAPSMVNAIDTLAEAEKLVEAVFMAAQALSRKECNALHAVVMAAKEKVEDCKEQLYEIHDATRKGGAA